MTNRSNKEGISLPKQSFVRRLTRSERKIPHVKLGDKKGKAIMVQAEPRKPDAKPAFVDLISSDSDTSVESDPSMETPAKASEQPKETFPDDDEANENEVTSKYHPIEYPIFPADYFDLNIPNDGTEYFIELKGKGTMLPGSPGRLPESIPIDWWWQELWSDNDPNSIKPWQKMVTYSRLTSHLRIPIDEAKKQGIEPETEYKANWYFDYLKEHS